MRVKEISYGYTFSTRPYESERIDLTATLDDGDDPVEATLVLKSRVLRLGGDERGAEAAAAAAHDWATARGDESSVVRD